MLRIALNGLLARPVRTALTAMAIVLGVATIAAAFTGLVTLARAAVRAMLRALTTKHFSRARSTLPSTSSAFSRITSEISEMISALALSSMRFSRNDRLLDLLRNVRLLSTSAMS